MKRAQLSLSLDNIDC